MHQDNEEPRGAEAQLTWEHWMLERMKREGYAGDLFRGPGGTMPDNAAEIVRAACKIFRNQAFHPLAIGMALSHKWGLQTIQAAPVIVQAANNGAGLKPSTLGCYPTAIYLGSVLGKQIDRGDKLAVIMSRYQLPLQLRALSGHALSPKRWNAVRYLRTIKPSTLAQIIPTAKARQNNWLYQVNAWQAHVERRTNQQRPDLHVEWAAGALRDVATYDMDITTVADFAIERGDTFCTTWTWAEAHAAATRWHDAQARRTNEVAFLKTHGVGWDDAIDYAPFPLELEVDGFKVVALATPAEIYMEGVHMRHCVRSYIGDVIKGTSRLFSIRQGDKRVATMELSNQTYGRPYTPKGQAALPPAWRCVQLKGPCNARVSAAVMNVATNWFREATGVGKAPTVEGMDVDAIRAAIVAAATPQLREE